VQRLFFLDLIMNLVILLADWILQIFLILYLNLKIRFVMNGKMKVCHMRLLELIHLPVCGVRYTWYGSVNGSDAKIPGRGFFLQRFPEILAYDVFEAACWKVYLAAPLFSEAECDFNRKLADIISGYAMQVHLPQDCGDSEHSRTISIQKEIFEKNLQAIDNADIVVAVIDGADADSGTSWEMGYAFAQRKKIISLRTDFRHVGYNERVNLMLEQSSVVVNDISSLIQALPCPIPIRPFRDM
jgi:Nucleoside 2-deoxyribosyltransferase